LGARSGGKKSSGPSSRSNLLLESPESTVVAENDGE
jgi:hypothetical protein